MNALFDGSYKSKPHVSLGGSHKNEGRESLLARVRKEREQREAVRRHVVASTVVQSAYRGWCTRKAMRESMKHSFDEDVKQLDSCDLSVFHSTTYKFLSFYSFYENTDQLVSKAGRPACASEAFTVSDHLKYGLPCGLLSLAILENITVFGRRASSMASSLVALAMIVLCQRWLSRRREIVSDPSFPSQLYQVKRLLRHCCFYLQRAGQRPLAVPLRMLEVFLSSATYVSSGSDGSTHMETLLKFLVQQGYYTALKSLLESHVPEPDDPTLSPPTPLADSLLKLITLPLLVSPPERSLITMFVDEVVGVSSLTAHTANLVVPLLKKELQPSVVMTALMHESHDGHMTLAVPASFELLHFVLTIAADRLNDLDTSSLVAYLALLSAVLRDKSPRMVQTVPVEEEDGDENEDEVVPVLTGALSPFLARRHSPVYAACLQTVNDNHIPNRLKNTDWPEPLLDGLCQFCYQLMYSHSIVPHASRLFQLLSMDQGLIVRIWESVCAVSVRQPGGETIPALVLLTRVTPLPLEVAHQFLPRLATFCILYSLTLLSIHDADFYRLDSAGLVETAMFSQVCLTEMCVLLRDAAVAITLVTHQRRATAKFWGANREEKEVSQAELSFVLQHMCKLLRYLHERDTRQQFLLKEQWVSPLIKYDIITLPVRFFIEEDEDEGTLMPIPSSARPYFSLLKQIPFVFTFNDRVMLFRRLVHHSIAQHQPLRGFGMGPHLNLDIRREFIYEDAFTQIPMDQDLRKPLHVRFTNLEGLSEAGIDGGGLFREFLSQLLQIGFDPNRGFFKANHEGQLHPNPQVHLIAPDYKLHYMFLGRILGKAIYENLLIELPLAGFFLKKLISRAGGRVDVHHLSSLDPELYRHLLFMKQYDRVEELALNFTVVNNDLGETQLVELKAGGQHVNVTADNREEFIHLLADYRLNKQIGPQCHAFIAGVASVIPLQWFQLFDEREIQVLISGAEVAINVEDLMVNTHYSGSFTAEHICIQQFWEVVSHFSEEDKKKLLKFVTSCSRPPLLGFKELYPKFCIHSSGSGDEHLPTASTCMNMLKLPEYSSAETLSERLLYAISSNAGFELS